MNFLKKLFLKSKPEKQTVWEILQQAGIEPDDLIKDALRKNTVENITLQQLAGFGIKTNKDIPENVTVGEFLQQIGIEPDDLIKDALDKNAPENITSQQLAGFGIKTNKDIPENVTVREVLQQAHIEPKGAINKERLKPRGLLALLFALFS